MYIYTMGPLVWASLEPCIPLARYLHFREHTWYTDFFLMPALQGSNLEARLVLVVIGVRVYVQGCVPWFHCI